MFVVVFCFWALCAIISAQQLNGDGDAYFRAVAVSRPLSDEEPDQDREDAGDEARDRDGEKENDRASGNAAVVGGNHRMGRTSRGKRNEGAGGKGDKAAAVAVKKSTSGGGKGGGKGDVSVSAAKEDAGNGLRNGPKNGVKGGGRNGAKKSGAKNGAGDEAKNGAGSGTKKSGARNGSQMKVTGVNWSWYEPNGTYLGFCSNSNNSSSVPTMCVRLLQA